MGRLVNVIGVRSDNFSRWILQGNWKKPHSVEFIDHSTLITGLFSSKKLQSFGLLLNSFSLKEYTGNKHMIQVNLIDTQKVGFSNFSFFRDKKALRLNKANKAKAIVLKLILLEKLILLNCQKVGLNHCEVDFSFSKLENISAYLVVNFIKIRLKQQYTLGSIIYPLARFLTSISGATIKGFRIDCSGRFSRRQRASYLSVKDGRLPFSSRNLNADYHFSEVILKFGKCGIKVWLFSQKKSSDKVVGRFINSFGKI